MKKKISDNPSYQKLRKEMEAAATFRKVLDLLDPDNKITGGLIKILDKVPEFQKHLENLASAPDDFNRFYSERGWAACESMKYEVIESAVNLAKDGRIEEGEKVIVEYFDQNLKWKVDSIRSVSEFKPRMRLIELALEDYYQKRFHSTIPILLMMIDGVVNDITKDLGLFAENVDVSAWDSIAAHESGLGQLAKLLSKTRKKTNSNSIDIPFRHGILHGKELSYDNMLVAVKTWSLLFVVRDWIVARKRPNQTETRQNKTIKESISELQQIRETNKLIDNWKAREILIGDEIPRKGSIEEYEHNSPEQATVKFISYWLKKNYGKMSEMIVRFKSVGQTDKKIAGELREAFELIDLTDYELKSIADKAPVVTEVQVNVVMMIKNRTDSKELTFRWIYMNEDDSLITRGQKGGRWYLIDNFRLELSLLKFK